MMRTARTWSRRKLLRAALFAGVFTPGSCAFAVPLAETYHEAKTALEAGDAARAVVLLEPALRDAQGAAAAPAQLALGLAYLRTGRAEAAVPLLEKAAAIFNDTPQACDALAPLGDALRLAGRADEARAAYTQASTVAPTRVNARYSAARLLELESADHERQKRFAAAARCILEAADGLLALGAEDAAFFAEARALFTKVAQGREWRGEATARAVFSLGEVERAQKHWPEAIAYYQRTFVSWLKFPNWCALAYLRAADCFDQLGKRAIAIGHLREMVRKADKFGGLPEYQEAKRQLRTWGEEVR